MILPVAALVLAMFAGAPLFSVIAAGALWGFHATGTHPSLLAVDVYRLAEMPVLVAIPLFTFAGYLIGESNAPGRLVRLTDALLGWMPGGLAAISLVACGLFTAFTGASGVTIVALGALLYPAMIQAGYPEKFTLGLVTTSGSLGLLFAPSLPLIIYAVVAHQMEVGRSVSIEAAFKAGVLPGGLMVALLAVYSFWTSRKLPRSASSFSFARAAAAIRESMWELPLPIAVICGIYGGWIAISEAAAVTAAYVILVEVFILREIPYARLPSIMSKSMRMVGAILIILAVSIASTSFMIDAEVPQKLFAWVKAHVESRFAFLMLLNVFLLLLGMLLDIFSALVLVVPLILPVATGFGIDPLHMGMIFLANMQVGYLTPPVGLSLFISSYRFERPLTEVYRACFPFIALLLAAVLVITYWPALSLWASG